MDHPAARPGDPVSAAVSLDAAGRAFVLPDDVAYLDCAAQAPRLAAGVVAAHAALDAAARPWASTAARWEASVEALRADMAALAFGGDADGVAMVPSAAYAAATAARCLPLARGDAVLLEDTTFPSVLLAWQQRCADVGASIVVAARRDPADRTGDILAALDASPRVRIACLSQAHWVDGALLDLDRVSTRVHDAGAALVLDLSQSLGALPADLARWQPDFVASVGYKWLLGAPGLSWLWASPRWRREGTPIEQHWGARDAGAGWRFDDATPPAYREGARRFDAGGIVHPVSLAIADAGLRQLRTWGAGAVETALRARVGMLRDAIRARGLDAWLTPCDDAHITALVPPAGDVDAAAAALRADGIVCTARYGRLRLSPHLHVDAIAVARVAEVLATLPR